jgi:chemotaxis protein MotB
MFDISPIVGQDFNLILSSFKGSLGMMQGGFSLARGRMEEIGLNMLNLPSSEQGRALAKMLKRAVEAFKPEIQAKKVRVREDERGLVITLSSDAYFEPGSAKLKDDIIPVLKKVAEIIKSMPNYARIEGHTDNRPVPPRGLEEGYATNWELSSDGQSMFCDIWLRQQGSIQNRCQRLFGEYRPIDDNNTPEGRAYNRRVEIVILRDKGIVESKTPEIARTITDEEWR